MGDAKRRQEAEARARLALDGNAKAQKLADPGARQVVEAMKDQLILVLIQRLGGSVTVPVAEIDATGGLLGELRIDGTNFVFTVRKKH